MLWRDGIMQPGAELMALVEEIERKHDDHNHTHGNGRGIAHHFGDIGQHRPGDRLDLRPQVAFAAEAEVDAQTLRGLVQRRIGRGEALVHIGQALDQLVGLLDQRRDDHVHDLADHDQHAQIRDQHGERPRNPPHLVQPVHQRHQDYAEQTGQKQQQDDLADPGQQPEGAGDDQREQHDGRGYD